MITRFLLLLILGFGIPLLNSACSPIPQKTVEENPENLLKVLDFADFVKTTKTARGTGSGVKDIYTYKDGTEFMLKMAQGTWGEPGWQEAYAGIIYRHFLKEHAQLTYFVKHDDAGTIKLYAAIKLEPTFEDAFTYHIIDGNPLLNDAEGLAGIVVLSMLLAEIDLKGISSNDSNLGIIEKNGQKIYYKIDNGQSFDGYNWPAYYKKFDFADPKDRLKPPKSDDAFLVYLGFKKDGRADFALTGKYLDAIASEAKRIAAVDDAELTKVLDFCETQLGLLATYPAKKDALDADVGNPMFSTPDKTYKDRIIKRFAQLRAALK